uniref:Secreted in xylem 4 n=4 Tax=Fusarium oxysporum TaxID=5507 RepID=A0A7G5WGW5_FUSOX|nr:secreted in xylem 4 [Fusarium oxysporum f. sp. lycopersici]AKC01499.1 avirulence protein 1 [Fusarium oxysporum f. sp. lycopersici]QMX85377.1 secreted in xylem 4 [Fusarium oxysporum]BAM37635.1 Secreted in xylem 4 protein [Fusarium oxysporum f. sp. lycopersici]CAJ84000.1 Secreted in xylem 4 protein [Fusarium oxysporum f. sp. lycopersici]
MNLKALVVIASVAVTSALPKGEEGDIIGTFNFSSSDSQPLKIHWVDTPDSSGSNLVKRSAHTESVCVHAGTATGADLHWLNAICTGKSTYTVNCAPAGNKNAGSTHTGTCPAGQDCFQLEQVGNFWGDREPDATCSPSNTVFDAVDDKEATHVNGKVVTRAGKPGIGRKLIRLKAQVYRRDGHYGQTSRMGFFRNGKEVYHIDNVASMEPTWNFDPSSDQSFSFFFTPGPNAFRIQGTLNLA